MSMVQTEIKLAFQEYDLSENIGINGQDAQQAFTETFYDLVNRVSNDKSAIGAFKLFQGFAQAYLDDKSGKIDLTFEGFVNYLATVSDGAIVKMIAEFALMIDNGTGKGLNIPSEPGWIALGIDKYSFIRGAYALLGLLPNRKTITKEFRKIEGRDTFVPKQLRKSLKEENATSVKVA